MKVNPLIVSLSLFLLIHPHATNRVQSAQDGSRETVIFSLSKYPDGPTLIMEPIVVLSAGKYTSPPVDAEPNIAKKFTENYFREGRSYRVLFGGGDAGSLTVKKEIEPGCVGLTAEADIQTSARLGGQVQALAVSSDNIGREESSRRAPTETERVQALALARTVYGQRKVSAALIKKMNTVNLTATDLNRDGKFELIGTFEITTNTFLTYNLFIIFELNPAGSYKAASIWYHKGSEESFENRSLVDVLDLDGDGTAEVVVEGHYYESNDYFIYKRQAGVWRIIYKGGGGGC